MADKQGFELAELLSSSKRILYRFLNFAFGVKKKHPLDLSKLDLGIFGDLDQLNLAHYLEIFKLSNDSVTSLNLSRNKLECKPSHMPDVRADQ